MTEINLNDYRKQEYYEGSNLHFNPFSTQKMQHHDAHKSKHVCVIQSNPRLSMRPKDNANEHHTYSNDFNGEDFQTDSLEPRYSSESFSRDNSFIPEPLTYNTQNQVNLIDFIGGNQRYQRHGNDM